MRDMREADIYEALEHLDRQALLRVQSFIANLLVRQINSPAYSPGPANLPEPAPSGSGGGVWMEIKWVKCGKGCSGCPHGPYIYKRWREGKKVRSKYLGRADAYIDESTRKVFEVFKEHMEAKGYTVSLQVPL